MSKRQNSPKALLTQGIGGRETAGLIILALSATSVLAQHLCFSSLKEMAAALEHLRAGKGLKTSHFTSSLCR